MMCLVPWGCLRLVIVVFPDHSHLLFWVIDQNFCRSWIMVAYK